MTMLADRIDMWGNGEKERSAQLFINKIFLLEQFRFTEKIMKIVQKVLIYSPLSFPL